MALDDAYGVRFQFRDHGRVWGITLHYKDATGVDEVDASNDLAVIANSSLGPLFDDIRAIDSTREGLYCWKMEAGTGLPDKLSVASIPGDTIFTESVPPNCCMVFTKVTVDPAAERFGRFYMGGLPQEFIENGAWTATAQATAGPLVSMLSATLVGALGSWVPVIYRTVSGGVPLVPPETSDISEVTITSVVYSQRRRNSRQIGSAV